MYHIYLPAIEPRSLWNSNRRQSVITIVYSWPTETGKHDFNIDYLYNIVNILRTIPDK